MAEKVRVNPISILILLIMASVGAIACYLHLRIHYINPTAEENKREEYLQEIKKKRLQHPTSVWADQYTPDTYEISMICESLTKENDTTIIFKHGTCIKVIGNTKDPISSAKASLKIAANPDAFFDAQSLPNHNYVIYFDEYTCYWLPAKEVAKIKKNILQHPSLRPLYPARNQKGELLSDFQMRLGNFAKALLLADARNPKVAEVIKGGQ